MLAIASFDATTALWQQVGDDYQCISTIKGLGNIKSVAWNATSTMFATCTLDQAVWLWEIMPGDECECLSVLTGHTGDINMAPFHPHIDILFSCSYDSSIKVWAGGHDDDWGCIQTLDETNYGHNSTVWTLSFNATGDRMVSCSDDHTLKFWRAHGLKKKQSLDGSTPWRHIGTVSGYHAPTVSSVNWSRRDAIIACGAAYGALCLFSAYGDEGADEDDYEVEEVEGGDEWFDAHGVGELLLKKNKAHDMNVNCVQWQLHDVLDPSLNPEKKLIASASDDGTIKIWEFKYRAGHGESAQ